MRYPKHIILDISKPNTTNVNGYWVNKYRSSLTKDGYFNSSLGVMKSLSPSRESQTSFKNSTTSFKSSPIALSSKLLNKDVRRETSLLWTLFDINFLKREKLYTKLKYSRSPAYDIVSGGVAALFAGFIGSLISEKFGIELVDSGDFYTFFMYVVFLFFSLRPLIKILSKDNTMWNFWSPKFLSSYFYVVVVLLFRLIGGVAVLLNKKFRIFRSLLLNTVGVIKDASVFNQIMSISVVKLLVNNPISSVFEKPLTLYSTLLHVEVSDDELRPFFTFFKNIVRLCCWMYMF